MHLDFDGSSALVKSSSALAKSPSTLKKKREMASAERHWRKRAESPMPTNPARLNTYDSEVWPLLALPPLLKP